MRSRALPTFCRNPSWVWENEMALVTFVAAAASRFMSAVRPTDSAKPAGSSEGDVIWEPEDNSASALFNMLVEPAKFVALVSAAIFVLITILTTLSLSHPLRGTLFERHPCRLVDLVAGSTIFPCRPFMAADRQLSCDVLHI